MARQFSLAHLTAIGCSPLELTLIAARCGYDFVSLRTIQMGLPEETNDGLLNNKRMVKELKGVFKQTGIQLLDIELARISEEHDPKSYVPAFEAAAELGGRHVLSSIWTNDRNYAVDRFAELCELAKPYGLTVELEFVPIAGINTLQGAVDILEKAKQDNAGLMIDIHHFHRANGRTEELEKVPQTWFRYCHLCDAPRLIPKEKDEMVRTLREERLYVGEGGIDVAGIINRIPNVPYSLEIPHKKRAQKLGYEAFAKRCLETAKEYFSTYIDKGSVKNVKAN
ncbi:sugar phosphate isomerase/epimerase family protein [Halalkalibacterium halodurans]|uniref:sugar phosphate isomerase/epimerase family protein n=1 Tax=Halalkalibacterium halodurans TaxID=86665 RepID=UPI002AA9C7D9|nr:TIM barrel protein [Halalkalibacterium halodurans]MDY7220922.1 TIM barrel protein [Halalkalibacterium halodurans]MDY7240161.1 TIM barrel protein [Halalkalibacterium halodurans]